MFIKVRVKASARRESIEKLSENLYEIQVKEKPERGEANLRVKEILARELHVPQKRIRFVSGQKSPSKLFEIL